MLNTRSIHKWEKSYADHQDYVYQNSFLKLFFDIGHKYIANNSKKEKGIVLDVGAGTGYHLKFQDIKKYKKYICLDANKGMLEKIQDKQVQKILASAEKIPLKDRSVDMIFASHVLEHIHALDKAMKDMNRVLKDGGSILVVLPCDPGVLWKTLTIFSPSRWLLKKAGFNYASVMKHEHVNNFSTCRSAVEKYFKVIEETYYPFFIKSYHANLLCCLTLRKR